MLPGCQEACQEVRRPCQEACWAGRRPVSTAAALPGGLSGGQEALSEGLPGCQEGCNEVKRPARKRNKPDPRDI